MAYARGAVGGLAGAHAEIDYEELVERLDDLDPGDKV